MKIDEKIQQLQSELVKVLIKTRDQSEEEVIQIYEKIGIKRELALRLIETFKLAEEARNKAKNVWENEATIDGSTEVAECQRQEVETRQKFDAIIEASSIVILMNKIRPNEVKEEIWQKLYEQGIAESQINSPSLRKDFHSFVERKEIENNPETMKMRALLSRVGRHARNLQKSFLELEKENEGLKAENKRLKDEMEVLKSSYNYIEEKFNTRIVSDEKNYQLALAEVKRLKRELRKSQNRGVFQTIGDKLFGNRTKGLPEPTLEIPSTLYESATERLGAIRHEERGFDIDKQVSNSERAKEDEELQQ